MKKTNLLKSMLLLCALVAGSGSVWADEIIYSWNGNGSTTTAGETGGTATAVQASGTNIVVGQAQNGNWSFKMNKGFSGSDYYVSIALDKPLNGGETITIGAFRSGSASTATLGFDFVNADTQALITDPQNLSSTGTPDDVVLTVPAEARGSKTVRIYRVAGSPALYVSKFIITYTGPMNPPSSLAGESFVEIASIKSDGAANSDGSCIVTSGNVQSTKKYGFSYGLKLESSSGVITITTPSDSKNAKVKLLSSASGTSLKLNNTTTPVVFSGNASDGYVTTINIPDASAGSAYTIKKGSGSPIIYKITLTYEIPSDTKLTLTTSASMDGWRAFYDGSQDYTLDANTNAYVVRAKSGNAGEVVLTKLDVTAIPHGEPVILKTSAANHKMVLTKTTGVATLGTNLLAVTNGSIDVDGYRLGYGDIGGSDKVGFFKYVATTPAAGIVFIAASNVNTGEAHGLEITFADDETTAIKTVNAEKQLTAPRKVMKDGRIVVETNEGMFSLTGARVK